MLSYLPDRRALLAAGVSGDLTLVTLFGDRAGTLDAHNEPLGAARLIYHPLLDGYLGWNPGDAVVAIVPAARGGQPIPAAARPLDLRGLAMESFASISIDPSSGDLYLLDDEALQIRRVPFSPARVGLAAGFDIGAACELTPGLPEGARVTTLAIQPGSSRLFAVGTEDAASSLYELDGSARPIAIHELAALGLASVSAMTFGPASDPRDIDRVSLYLAGAGNRDATGADGLVEVATGQASPRTSEYLDLVAASRTSEWLPPSADPGGIAYDPARGSLVVTDPEIDELTLFAGTNVFFVDSTLTPFGGALMAFTDEPSDVAHDPATGDYFVSNDRNARIFRVEPGPDDALGGEDDRVSSFSTELFGSNDPDGLSIGQNSLFVADGANARVYRITPGPDGAFTGVEPDGDDVVVGFDTGALGITDPEGIAFDPARGTLYLVTNERASHLVELTTTGLVLRSIDLGFLPISDPSGLALAPSSDDPARQSVYIVDRGIDTSQAGAAQNDGLLFEVRLERGEPRNPVRNGGFEADINVDSLPDGWDVTGGQRVGASEAHSGEGALLLSAQSGPVDARYQLTVPSAATGGVDFSGWARSLPGSVGEVIVRISWRDAAGVTSQTERLAKLVPGTDWVEMSGTAKVAPGAVEANLTVELATGAIVLDDIVLTSVP